MFLSVEIASVTFHEQTVTFFFFHQQIATAMTLLRNKRKKRKSSRSSEKLTVFSLMPRKRLVMTVARTWMIKAALVLVSEFFYLFDHLLRVSKFKALL